MLVVLKFLWESNLSMLVYDVAFAIDKVSFRVNFLPLAIYEVAISIAVKNWISKRVHFKVAQNVLHVELGEGEDLRNLIVFEMLFLKDFTAILINDVAELVNKITTRVDSASKVVNEVLVLVSLRKNVAESILVNLANCISNVKPSTVVVKQLG